MKTPGLQAIPIGPGTPSCHVYVEIYTRAGQRDRFANLVLKQAVDVLEDAVVTIAERLGGKRGPWTDHAGEFVFTNGGADLCCNSCQAAIEMLDELRVVKRDIQLPDDLAREIAIRIFCDAGSLGHVGDGSLPAHHSAADIIRKLPSGSADNNVIISERVFEGLQEPLKSRFLSGKRPADLGMNFFVASDRPPAINAGVAEIAAPADTTSPEQSPQEAGAPKRAQQLGLVSKNGFAVLKSRLAVITVIFALLLLAIVAFEHYWPRSPSVSTPQYLELVQSDDWRLWRKQIHERFSTGKITEAVLADALRIKPPARPEPAPAALRRDQAIADVLMTYPDVREILRLRFGISEDGFLGTGLSKPVAAKDYGAAAVHEYLIRNYPDYHPAVWMRIIDPNKNPKDMTITVRELFENDSNPDAQKKSLVEGIAQRVRENDIAAPAVIRFAILDLSKYSYSHRLGRDQAYRVFVSNLAEVWNSRVRDAANLSGHTFTKGDSLYIWAFLPETADEIVPATWGELLKNLPTWLDEQNKNN